MIERVARAICAESCENYEMLPGIHDAVARAAIEAMRELPAGHPILSAGITTAELWCRSIDAALKETTV